MKRTGSAGSRVPPAVTAMRLPARSPYSRPMRALAWATIAPGSSRRPAPTSPDARRPSTGPRNSAPRVRSSATLSCVAALAHICASIAGAISVGPRIASAVSETKSSAMPCAMRAIVEALAGTIR